MGYISKLALFISCAVMSSGYLFGQASIPRNAKEDSEGIMSEAYWKIWDPKVQGKIDRDIEQYRKADAIVDLPDAAEGTEVQIEQISHDFIFGASSFNFNQLGTYERNRKYREVFGSLFNRATVAFYWKTFEMQPNRPRFCEEYWDTEDFWNKQADPKSQPHWRRPAPDPIIDWCISRGVAVHGHPLIWGNRKWHNPNWIIDQMMTPDEKEKMDKLILEYGNLQNYRDSEKYSEEYGSMSASELESEFPEFTKTLNALFKKRIDEIAKYYGNRVSSWDVVNESATDFASGRMIPGSNLCKSNYGLMPGDYTFLSFKIAENVFPDGVLLNINDYWTGHEYIQQVNNLVRRGAKINVMGSQMHLFNPQQCQDIANGKELRTPDEIWKLMDDLSSVGLPICISEITITAPSDDSKGRMIQAIIARNLYRIWFSSKNMMGITWWNLVDDCGAPGEPTTSGIFTRDMEPKTAFYALDELINHEWKTITTAKASKGQIRFRGFRGKYLITYTDKNGETRTIERHVK